jgi:outer membrane receptor protein involved in Fe transport
MAVGIVVMALSVLAIQAGPAAGTGTLSGVVFDQQGGVIGGAAVEVTCGDVSRQATTDIAGEFRIDHLPPRQCTTVATASGFKAQSAEVDLSNGRTSAKLMLVVEGYATEVVVTPGRGVREDGFTVPGPVSVLTRRDIDSRPYQLLGQVLREEPGVLVQQTTSAQVSPIIRGFTGQSNVYLVDGVRLNTAAWRSGPSQYFSWVDGAVADRLEILHGPGSVEYGSDALGGTVNVLTAPSLFSAGSLSLGGIGQVQIGTADESAAGEAGVYVRGSRAALRAVGSKRAVDDLRGGDDLDSHSAITRFLGLPSTVLTTKMLATDYQQSALSVGGTLDAGGAATLSGLFMHTDLTGSSRYDRVLGGAGLHSSGFEPQRLDFGFVKYQRPDTAGFDGVSATFSLNRQADGRFEQARPTSRIDSQDSVTRVLGYQAQAHRTIASRHRLLVGAEFYDELTTAQRELLEPNGTVVAARPDIPDGTTYRSFGLFAQDSVELFNDRLTVRGGARYGRYAFETTADETLGVTAESETMDAFTFQLGTVISLNSHMNAVVNVSRGFRAANAADLGDIGLSGGGGFVITPSEAAALGGFVATTDGASGVSTGERVPALQSEVLYAYEAGLKFRSRRLDAGINVYDLEYFDTIQRRAIAFESNMVGTTISGFEVVRQDPSGLAYIAQDVRPIATRVNADRARILGFNLHADARLSSAWTAAAHFSLNNGRLLETDEYLRRMPPPMGGARLRWSGGRTWVEGAMTFARTQTRLNSGDLSDARIGGVRTRSSIAGFFNGTATDLGLVQNGILVETGETLAQVQNRLLGTESATYLFTEGPGFIALHLRGGWRITETLEVSAIGENLTDRNYRLYGSGLDAAGANLQLRARFRF